MKSMKSMKPTESNKKNAWDTFSQTGALGAYLLYRAIHRTQAKGHDREG